MGEKVRRTRPTKRFQRIEKETYEHPKGRWKRLVESIDFVEKHPVTKLFGWLAAGVTIVVTLMTFWQISADIEDREDERTARQEERLDRALTRLRERASGDSGKGWALNVILNQSVVSPVSLDLSCKNIGSWDTEYGTCAGQFPVFAQVTPPVKQNGKRMLPPIVFEQSVFTEAAMESTKIYTDPMRNVTFEYSDLSSSTWSTNRDYLNKYEPLQPGMKEPPAKILVFDSDMSFAEIEAHRKTIEVHRSNLSGVTITDPGIEHASDGKFHEEDFSEMFFQEGSFWRKNWAWADFPPKFRNDNQERVVSAIASITLCDPSERKGGDGKETVGGFMPNVPRFSVLMLFNDLECKELTVDEAKARFPDAYKAKPVSRKELN